MISEKEFSRVLDFIKRKTGIRMPDVNYQTVKRAVAERCALLELTVAAYLQRLERDDEEKFLFYNKITINETYLFREEKQFEILKSFVFPELAKRGREVTLWSVTCSTGEEAISLALVSEEYYKERYGLNFRVVGSDLSRSALARYEEGVYSPNSFRKDGLDFHKLADRYGSYRGKEWLVGDEIRERITLFHLNLFQEHYEEIPRCDLIFFRNTLIYMEKAERDFILDRVVERLKVGGYIFLSLNETHLLEHSEMELRSFNGIYYFYKTGLPRPLKEESPGEVQEETGSRSPAVAPVLSPDFELSKVIELASNEEGLGKMSSEEPNVKLATALLNALHHIYRCSFDEVKQEITGLEDIMGENELICYLKALSMYHKDRQSRGEELFSRAVYYNGSFWPAYYYLGKIHLESSPRRAQRELIRCKTILEKELADDSHPYSFLLEGFSEKYFYDMAVKMLEKSERT